MSNDHGGAEPLGSCDGHDGPYRREITSPEVFHEELHLLMLWAERCGMQRSELGAVLLHMMTDAFVRGGGTADEFADAARTMFQHVQLQIATVGS